MEPHDHALVLMAAVSVTKVARLRNVRIEVRIPSIPVRNLSKVRFQHRPRGSDPTARKRLSLRSDV